MQLAQFLLPFNWLTRMLASFSVRTRIVLLALIPVAGFVANGFTYTSGEGDVGRTFDTFTRSAALADASRDFKSAVASMRIVVKDFNVKPSDNLVASFEYAHAIALRNLDTIEASVDKGRAESIAGMTRDVNALRESFNNLVREQNTLGFDESSGLRRQLQVAGNAVERIINDNMSWLPESEAARLLTKLLYMRHHEADFRVTESEIARQQFQQAYKSFNDTIRPINATPEMKSSLEQVVKTYAETFKKWVESYDKVRPLHAVIDIDSQNMLPRADDIITHARKTAEAAGQQLAKSQSRTRNGIIIVGIAMVAL
jgi:methyl-accepting chemotaxis protein